MDRIYHQYGCGAYLTRDEYEVGGISRDRGEARAMCEAIT